MKVLVKYSQKFMGEILNNEYISFVTSDDEIDAIYEALYSDPHVYSVDVEKLGGTEDE